MTTLAACSGSSGGDDAAAKQTGNNGAGQSSSPAGGATSGAANSGFPIVQQPITLKMFSRLAPNSGASKDLLVWQEYQKKTGINLTFEDVPTQGFPERKNLAFASNDLPDFFFRSALTPLESIKYGTAGQLIPLEGLIDKYAPNFKALMNTYPGIKADITFPNGHIYSLPMVVTTKPSLVGMNWINQSWLNKLGLSMPQTPDELINVLKAFKDKDPNGNGKADEIPLSNAGPADNGGNIPLVEEFAGSFGLDRQFEYNANVVNGKVHLWMADDNYKQILQFLNQLWTQKLIDPQYFTQTQAQYIAKMTAGQIGMMSWGNNNPFIAHAADYKGMPPLKGPNGDQKYVVIQPMTKAFGAFAITSANKHPEETMRWVDYFYGKEGATFIRYGVEGKTFNYDTNGEAQYVDSIAKSPTPDVTACKDVTPFCGGAFPHWLNDKNDSLVNNEDTIAAVKVVEPYLPDVKYGPLLFDEKTAKDVDNLRRDIDTYVKEQSTKFIVGEIGFDKWDEYVSTLKKMNLDKLQDIFQQAFDAKKK
jgi:putative aldouronate transport system substrate-binding protein